LDDLLTLFNRSAPTPLFFGEQTLTYKNGSRRTNGDPGAHPEHPRQDSPQLISEKANNPRSQKKDRGADGP
jgi:hypothetical protein